MSGAPIDGGELLRTRLAHGLSRRQLARLVGLADNTIRRLEAGHATSLRVEKLIELADVLGVQPQSLMSRRGAEPSTPSANEAKAAAALAASKTMIRPEELAEAFGWDPGFARATLVRLRRQLAGTGLALRRTTNGFALVADSSALSPEEASRLERARVTRRGLRIHEAALLRACAYGAISTAWERTARNSERVALAALLKAGYVQLAKQCYVVSAAIQSNWKQPERLHHREPRP